MVLKLAVLSILLISPAIYACEHSETVQKLLPTANEYVVACHAIIGGQSSNVFLCQSSTDKWYIFRYYKNIILRDDFERVLTIAQKAADLQIHPKLYGFNIEQQQTLMDYIEMSQWPSYIKNSQPYHAAMQTLRVLHDALRSEIVYECPNIPAPFLSVYLNEPILMSNPDMPKQLGLAFDIVKQWNERVAPWLATHATICHGDFTRSNVLLQKDGMVYRPWVIDFDSAAIGHPYFDVVKFLKKLTSSQRMDLFESYLGHAPTDEEISQFNIIDNVMRMVVVIIRFKLAFAIQKAGNYEECLSQKDMEALLDSANPLPSHSTIPLHDTSLKMQQLAAVYALHEFLRFSRSIDVA